MYKPTIGLEIHAELLTKTKMFCSCQNDPNEIEANKNVCPVCLGYPGTLPTINEEAVRKVIKAAIALNCSIEKKVFFERKNYFYPDLPKGYQISQYQVPMGRDGFIVADGKKIRIERVHLEEDAGKLVHPENSDYSLVDFNRAGVPLMELVTMPDVENASEARAFVKQLQLILRYLGVSEANMEKGQLRCEVNISVSKKEGELGTKVEIKNLNSLRVVEKVIEYETKRQIGVIESGGKVIQETRGWDEKAGKTFSQRIKEEANDYRYFPEPDLPPIKFSDEFLAEVKAGIPELPLEKKQRFIRQYSLSEKDAEFYAGNRRLADYFEEVISELENWIEIKEGEKTAENESLINAYKLVSNYISSDLMGILGGGGIGDNFPITPENFAEFISMVYKKEISSKIAKSLLKAMYETGGDPSQILEEKGLKLITDEGKISEAAKEVIAENEKAVSDYKAGKETAIQFLIGQLMKKTKGTASPEGAKSVLKKILDEN